MFGVLLFLRPIQPYNNLCLHNKLMQCILLLHIFSCWILFSWSMKVSGVARVEEVGYKDSANNIIHIWWFYGFYLSENWPVTCICCSLAEATNTDILAAVLLFSKIQFHNLQLLPTRCDPPLSYLHHQRWLFCLSYSAYSVVIFSQKQLLTDSLFAMNRTGVQIWTAAAVVRPRGLGPAQVMFYAPLLCNGLI